LEQDLGQAAAKLREAEKSNDDECDNAEMQRDNATLRERVALMEAGASKASAELEKV
jgi:hypothetical protein